MAVRIFESIGEAFQNFCDNDYPSLPPEEKEKLKNSVFRFRKNDPSDRVTHEKMRGILTANGYSVQTLVAKKNQPSVWIIKRLRERSLLKGEEV